MGLEQKEHYKIYQAGGCKFPVYIEYDEQLDQSYPAYPDFEEHPEYTGESRPFATAEQESCPHCKPAPRRLRRLRLVLLGANTLRPHRRLHVRYTPAGK